MNIDRIDKMKNIYETLSEIDQDDPLHIIRFLAIKNDSTTARELSLECMRSGVYEVDSEECKARMYCRVHELCKSMEELR